MRLRGTRAARARLGAALGLGLWAAGALGPQTALALRAPAPVCDAGWLLSALRDAEGGTRVRALGPLVEWSDAEGGRTLRAVRPFAVRETDPALGHDVVDVLWPLVSVIRFGRERDWRVLLLLRAHDFDTRDRSSRWRFWLLPVLYAGRSADGRGYGAVFPIGGEIREFLGRDRIDFVLFPLYSYSTLNDLRTWNVLWPVFSLTRGDDTLRMRAFPVYGYSRRGADRRTFVMWPVWSSATYGEPGQSGYAWMLFPVCGRARLPRQQTWMVLPPLFRWTQAGSARAVNAPWPFVQLSRGDLHKTYLWPAWGVRRQGAVQSGFALWPVCQWWRTETEGETRTRRLVVPFLIAETVATAREGGEACQTERYLKVWPVFSRAASGDRSVTRVLDLWPGKPFPPVERNLAPFWTVFRRERKGDAIESECLWGLGRRLADGDGRYTSVFPLVSWSGSRENDRRRWDLLMGLVGYQREGSRRSVRLLYFIRIGSAHEPDNA